MSGPVSKTTYRAYFDSQARRAGRAAPIGSSWLECPRLSFTVPPGCTEPPGPRRPGAGSAGCGSGWRAPLLKTGMWSRSAGTYATQLEANGMYLVGYLDPHEVDVGEVVGIGAPPRQEFREAVRVREHVREWNTPSAINCSHIFWWGMLRPAHTRWSHRSTRRDDVLVDPVNVLHRKAHPHGGQPRRAARRWGRQKVPFLESRADVLLVPSHLLFTCLRWACHRSRAVAPERGPLPLS